MPRAWPVLQYITFNSNVQPLYDAFETMLAYSFAFTGKSFLQLDHPLQSSLLPVRVLSMFVLVMSYLCFEFYTADLIALMTVSAKVPVVRSFDEAIEEDFRLV